MGINKEQDKFIAQLYQEMYTQLCIYAMNALNDKGLAEESVQDTFRVACMKVDSLMESDNPKGWIMLTLKNVLRNIQKNRAIINNLVVSSLAIDEMEITAPNNDMEFNILYSSLLDKDDYKLLKMITIDKYTMLETSQEFGISIEACKKRVQRAKKKLQKIIENNS